MPKAKERMTSYTDGKDIVKRNGKDVEVAHIETISCSDNFLRKSYNWFTVTRKGLALAENMFLNYWGEGDGHGFEFTYKQWQDQIAKTEKVLKALKENTTKAKYDAMIKSKVVAKATAKANKKKDSKKNWQKKENNRLLG